MTKLQIDVIARIYFERILKAKKKVLELESISRELDQLKLDDKLLTDFEKQEIFAAIEVLLKSEPALESASQADDFGFIIVNKSLEAQDNSGLIDLISALKRGTKK